MTKRIVLFTVLTILVLALAASFAYAGTTERVSVDSNGIQGNKGGSSSNISCDGRYVVFKSDATNLVPGDTNGITDIFVHDRETGVTERVSVDSNENQSNGYSGYMPSISCDGRYVAFSSQASNLVPGDTNGLTDVFVRDREAGTTTRISVNSNGEQGNWHSSQSFVSDDGRYIVFSSGASNLVSNDANGMISDIFVYDMTTGTLELVSKSSEGTQGQYSSASPAMSCDNRFITYSSHANNLVPGDTNSQPDIFIYDMLTGITERVSVNSNGIQGNLDSYTSAISCDGRYVAFASRANNLVDVETNYLVEIFVRDRELGTTEIVSVDNNGNPANRYCNSPSISGDGRYVSFASEAFNLVPEDPYGDSDIFVHDRATHSTEIISVRYTGEQTLSGSHRPYISRNGRYVTFDSADNYVVSGDTNYSSDVFVTDLGVELDDVITDIGGLLDSGDVANAGVATSLTSLLNSALLAEDNGNIYAERNTLLAFIRQVEGQAGRTISEEAAAELIDAANQILATLE